MTIDQFILKIEGKLAEIEKTNKPLELAVRSIMSMQSKRVFLEGKNADDGIIGNYSKKAIYVSPNANKSLPKFPLNGKPDSEGKTTDTKTTVFNISTRKKQRINVKATGDERKTGYFPNYLAFKTAIGRNKRVQTVDLFLTGTLQRNWANSEALSKANAKKVNQHRYVVTLSEINKNKVDRYKNVFGLSVKEKDMFLKVITAELIKALK